VTYAHLSKAVLILGSATPEVSWLYRAHQEKWNIVRLPLRILAHRQAVEQFLATEPAEVRQTPGSNQTIEGDATYLPLPPVRIVDMRQELKAGNRSIFSRALHEAIQHTLDAKQQAILFLNRRGTATYVFCRECGYAMRCPRCDLPLTFHLVSASTGEGILICHTCSYQRQVPKKCPECGSSAIRQFGTGTEKLESEAHKEFPGARVLRWDYDTTRQKGAHDVILSHIANHRADLIVGTQMLAKGLDLPLVTLVGVVLADVGLYLPDFRASERTFQLMVQVAGRAGRSPLGGQVILQSFNPNHYALQAAARHDFDGFYNYEIRLRRRMEYPPFTRLVRVEVRDHDAQVAERKARQVAGLLQQWVESGGFEATHLIGAVPCFYSRLDGAFRWQVILRGPNPTRVLQGKDLQDWRVEVDPVSLL
jgi:primosomal protein N' (replication factor Y)